MQLIPMVKEISRIAKANAQSSSLRATIPMRIVERLELEIGNVVEWELFTDSKGEKRASIRKLK